MMSFPAACRRPKYKNSCRIGHRPPATEIIHGRRELARANQTCARCTLLGCA